MQAASCALQGCRLQGCRLQGCKAAGCRQQAARLQAARLQAAGCALQGCRQQVAHCKAAGSRLQGCRPQRCKAKAPHSLITLPGRLPLRRGDNAVLLQFGTPKSLHLPRASACNKQNLLYFRKTRGQTGTKCCKLQHGLPVGGGGE